MRYALWFNGNNWEERIFQEEVDAAMFVETFLENGETQAFVWFITTKEGRDILIEKGVVAL